MMPSEFMTQEQAAVAMGVTINALRYMRGKHGPPFYKVGVQYVYRRADIETFIAAQEMISFGGMAGKRLPIDTGTTCDSPPASVELTGITKHRAHCYPGAVLRKKAKPSAVETLEELLRKAA